MTFPTSQIPFSKTDTPGQSHLKALPVTTWLSANSAYGIAQHSSENKRPQGSYGGHLWEERAAGCGSERPDADYAYLTLAESRPGPEAQNHLTAHLGPELPFFAGHNST